MIGEHKHIRYRTVASSVQINDMGSGRAYPRLINSFVASVQFNFETRGEPGER